MVKSMSFHGQRSGPAERPGLSWRVCSLAVATALCACQVKDPLRTPDAASDAQATGSDEGLATGPDASASPAPDAGRSDSGTQPPDAAGVDGGDVVEDAKTSDAALDGSREDALDGSPGEAADAHDARTDDATAGDGAAEDATLVDATLPDASAPDASIPEASAPDADVEPPEPSLYDDDDKWLCRPGLADSICNRTLSVTDVHPDGTTSVYPLPATPEDAAADCFYLYPTVDPGLLGPRNLDFDQIDIRAVRDIGASQIPPFRELCHIYAPIYRQASLSAISDPDTREEGLGIAYDDVQAAFDVFLRDTQPARPILLIVHSQGARHTVRLMKERFEGHPELLDRLVVAVLAGPMGGFLVPDDQPVGGSLSEIPLCTSEEQTGCVLTWNTFSEQLPADETFGDVYGLAEAGDDTGCTTPPGGIDGAVARLSGAMFYLDVNVSFPLSLIAPQYDFGAVTIETPYARYADFYTARCAEAGHGVSYLEIAGAPLSDDVRVDPVPYDNVTFTDPGVGLHAIDYAFVSTDIVEAARAKLAAHLR